jgi:hypothetical protein
MTAVARLSQLFSRWIAFGLFWAAGLIAGNTLSSEAEASIRSFSEAIAIALAGIVAFLIDLWLHRLQKSKNPQRAPQPPVGPPS